MYVDPLLLFSSGQNVHLIFYACFVSSSQVGNLILASSHQSVSLALFTQINQYFCIAAKWQKGNSMNFMNSIQPLDTMNSVSNEEWKVPLQFLTNYGYDLQTLTPSTRIRVTHNHSLTSNGGRSAPCVYISFISYNIV